jgi:hypothetical protein
MQFHRFTAMPSSGLSRLWVPAGLLDAWFPGAPLPLNISLQLEVDGHTWGHRFDSRVDKARQITKGLRQFAELEGCDVTAFRRAAGPAALDLILSSVRAPGQMTGGERRGLRRQLEPEDLESNTWPVVRSARTCDLACL